MAGRCSMLKPRPDDTAAAIWTRWKILYSLTRLELERSMRSNPYLTEVDRHLIELEGGDCL
jgi:hypothetical protein